MSATSIIENLSKEKYNIHMVGITKDGRWLLYRGDPSALADGSWEKDEQNVPAFLSPDSSVHGLLVLHQDGAQVLRLDAVFPALHGKNGEDGTIQGLFQLSGIPYVGCDTFSSAVCMDKAVTHTLLSEGCEIYGDVSESVLFSDVTIGKGAKVEYSILMPGAVVEEGATVRYSIVAEKAVIAKGAEVGGSPSDSDADNWGVAVVAEGVRIGSGAKLAAKEMADEDLPDVK